MEVPRGWSSLEDGEFFHANSFHMDDIVDVLKRAFEEKKLSLNDCGAVLFEDVGSDDDVGDSGLVFETEKDETFRGTGTLPCDDATADTNPLAIVNDGK